MVLLNNLQDELLACIVLCLNDRDQRSFFLSCRCFYDSKFSDYLVWELLYDAKYLGPEQLARAKRLVLNNTGFDDVIKHTQNLEELWVRIPYRAFSKVVYRSELDNLKRLYIHGDEYDNKLFSKLLKLDTLHIIHSGTINHFRGSVNKKRVENLPDLVEVSLACTIITPQTFTTANKLKILHLSNVDSDFDISNKLKTVNELTIHQFNYERKMFNYSVAPSSFNYSALTNLRVLEVSYCVFNGRINLPNIVSLSISYCETEDSTFHQFCGLKKLCVTGVDITGGIFRYLPLLESIFLSNCKVIRDCDFVEQNQVKSFEIEGCSRFVGTSITKLSKLETLRVISCERMDESIEEELGYVKDCYFRPDL